MLVKELAIRLGPLVGSDGAPVQLRVLYWQLALCVIHTAIGRDSGVRRVNTVIQSASWFPHGIPTSNNSILRLTFTFQRGVTVLGSHGVQRGQRSAPTRLPTPAPGICSEITAS